MEVIHVDADIIVVNKPPGLAVLPDGWDPTARYLVQLLEAEYGKTSANPDSRIWIVHRLDKQTSGVIIFARTAGSHRELNRQFEQHEAVKIYYALVQGVPPWDEMTARHPLRADVGHKHRTAVDMRRGKDAETQFKVLRRFEAAALVEARLLTGRTHQIRAHAYALGYSLLGDVLYGATPSEIIERPALHAGSLSLKHPTSGMHETYTAPYPQDFENALKRLGA